MEAGKIAFEKLCHEELLRAKARDGIGLYAEKTLHGVLKRWVCEDMSCHEQHVIDKDFKKSRFVADVLTKEGHIFEVQTGKLYPLLRKIEFYLSRTDCHVTVVHPLTGLKWLSWMDKESGEITSRRRSPLCEAPIHIMGQLRPFLPFIGNERFSVLLPIVEINEFRFLDGWGKGGKRGSHRYESMPLTLLDTVLLRDIGDYVALFPTDLPPRFYAKDFSKITHMRGYALYDALHVFEALGLIREGTRTKKGVEWIKN